MWHRFGKAARAGDCGAQFKLGCAHEAGEGVKRDASEALKW